MTAIVEFSFKNIKEELKETATYQNKKMARMFASFKMLKKIYLSFPQIWTIFSQIRSDKSLGGPPASELSFSILNQSVNLNDSVTKLKV